MRMEIKISVIIPIYNAERTLRQCLDSVINQSLKEIEVICVDDGSTDSTADILAEYAAADERIVVLHQENQFAGAARNNGIRHARGEYLAFLDSDDYFVEDALDKIYERAAAMQADVCVFAAKQYYEKLDQTVDTAAHMVAGRVPADPFNLKTNPEFILNFTTVEPWNKVYRREYVRKKDIKFLEVRNGEDVYFVVPALCQAERITVLPDHLICYRIQREDSLTGTVSVAPIVPVKAWIATKELLEKKGCYPKKSFDNRCAASIFNLFNNVETEEAFVSLFDFVRDEGIKKLDLALQPDGYYLNQDPNEFLTHLNQDSVLGFASWLNHKNTAMRIEMRIRRNAEKDKKLAEKAKRLALRDKNNALRLKNRLLNLEIKEYRKAEASLDDRLPLWNEKQIRKIQTDLAPIMKDVEEQEALGIKNEMDRSAARRKKLDDGSLIFKVKCLRWDRQKKQWLSERQREWTAHPLVLLTNSRLEETEKVLSLDDQDPLKAGREEQVRRGNLAVIGQLLDAMIQHSKDTRDTYPWLDWHVKLFRNQLMKLGAVTPGVLSDESLLPKYQTLFDECWDVIGHLERGEDIENLKGNLRKFRAIETNLDRSNLEKLYLKTRLTQAFEEASKKPLEKKVLILQPREGLNGSMRLVYEELKKDPDIDTRVCSLYWNITPRCYSYILAERFAQDAATAQALLCHETTALLGRIKFRPEQRVIQLWHGCGVFKTIGEDLLLNGVASVRRHREVPNFKDYSMVTIPSPAFTDLFSRFMGIPKDAGILQPVGMSRTDVFFDQDYISSCYRKLYERIPAARGRKIILYAPTYRGVEPMRTTPDKLDIGAFYEALGEDYILIFKHHQTAQNLPEIPEKFRESFAFDLTHDDLMDIYSLMTVSDICISDYSSVVYEFALFERPMLFYLFDYEDYKKRRGIYEDYLQDSPGPKCRTNEEMIDYIRNIKERFDIQEVKDFKNKYMKSCDGHATERVVSFIRSGMIPQLPDGASEQEEKKSPAEMARSAYLHEAEQKGDKA